MIACALTPAMVPSRSLTPAPSDTPTNAPLTAATETNTPRPSPGPTSTDLQIPTATAAPAAGGVPRPDHVVVVILENRGYAQIFGSACCPYLNQQANISALMTHSFAVTHPSQPNYLDLFSSSNQGVTDDSCPPPGSPYAEPNLGQQLIDAGLTFTGFSEDLPDIGSTTCDTSTFALRHVPWAAFSNVPPEASQPWSSFPSDFTTLPTLSFVIPNLCDDMHDCGPRTADDWLSANLDGYIQWAQTSNSLLVITFDEDDSSGANHILTFFEGPMVQPGKYSERITHYNVLRTLEAMYGLPYAGHAANAATITDIWSAPASPTP